MSILKNVIKKADIFLLICLIIIGLAFTALIYAHSTSGNTVEITVAGELYGTYALDEDREIDIVHNGHTNKVIIKDGQVQMIEASCHNQLCIKQGTIGMPNQQIICLPNRVVVRIVSDKGGDVDVISG